MWVYILGKGAFLSRKRYLYEGDWKCGVKHGYGVLSRVSEDGSYVLLYEGDWKNDKPEVIFKDQSNKCVKRFVLFTTVFTQPLTLP